ncbi:type II secretion system minor pseudopilin GspK, partial [Natronospira sp.]
MRRQQRGVALITALVVVAISAVIAADLAYRTFLDRHRTEAVLHVGQAHQYLRGAEDLAGHLLRRASMELEHHSLDQPWADEIPPLPVDGGQILARMEDRQGRFNLNNLVQANGHVNEAAYQQFRVLLETLELDPELADPVVDWIDYDQEPRGMMGAEDGTYLGFDPAYRAGNQGFQSVTELRLVAGFQDPEVFEQIAPHVTALPTEDDNSWINVNTATAPVLRSLAANPDEAQVDRILEVQEAGGFESVSDFHDIFGPPVRDGLA